MAVDRSKRIAYARRLINKHPSWGRRKIAQAVKEHYGVGLRSADVTKLIVKHKARVSRAARVNYATELITSHPAYGRRRINDAVKKEFGVGLRIIDIARLKDKTLGVKTKYPGRKSIAKLIKEEVLTPEIAEAKSQIKIATIGFDAAFHMLRSSGFLDVEIRQLFSAYGVSLMLSSEPFKAMLKKRRAIIRKWRKEGLSNADIIERIKKHYSPKDIKGELKNSPFEFLRAEYGVDMLTRRKTPGMIALALRKQKRADAIAERLYGKGRRLI